MTTKKRNSAPAQHDLQSPPGIIAPESFPAHKGNGLRRRPGPVPVEPRFPLRPLPFRPRPSRRRPVPAVEEGGREARGGGRGPVAAVLDDQEELAEQERGRGSSSSSFEQDPASRADGRQPAHRAVFPVGEGPGE